MKIYIVRYCQKGFTDGIRLFTTLKAAQQGAKKAIGWGAWRATIYETKGTYSHEIDYTAIETHYKGKEEQP